MNGNVELDLAEEDWQPRALDTPRGRLRIQVVSVQRTEPPIDPAYVWVDGWRFLDEQDPAPVPARELVRFAALPPELRSKMLPAGGAE